MCNLLFLETHVLQIVKRYTKQIKKEIIIQCPISAFRPVIKENTAHVVATCQNVLLLWQTI